MTVWGEWEINVKKISVHFSSKEIVSAYSIQSQLWKEIKKKQTTLLLPTLTGEKEMKRKGDTTITIVSQLYSYNHVPKEKILCQLIKNSY